MAYVMGSTIQRRRIVIQGIVQGVGFRPFVYGLALRRELVGFVWAIACQVKPAEQPAAPEIIRTCRGKVYRLEPAKKFQKAK